MKCFPANNWYKAIKLYNYQVASKMIFGWKFEEILQSLLL